MIFSQLESIQMIFPLILPSTFGKQPQGKLPALPQGVSALSSVGCYLLSGLDGWQRTPVCSALLAVLWIPVHKKFLAYVIYTYTHTSHSRSCPWTGILSTASNLVMLLMSSQFYKFLCKYFITKPCKIYFSSLWKNWILIFLFCNEEEILT